MLFRSDAIASLCHKEEAEYITNYIYWIEKDSYKMKKELFKTQRVEVSSPEVGANVGDLFSNVLALRTRQHKRC